VISGQALLVEKTTGRHTCGRGRPIDAIRGGQPVGFAAWKGSLAGHREVKLNLRGAAITDPWPAAPL